MHGVVLERVSKAYRQDSIGVQAVTDISLHVRPDRFTVISGPSGSGKTTLLNLMGCIDRPDQGDVIVGDQRTRDLSDDELTDFRARHIGFVFQNFNLLPVLTAYENVEYPLLLRRAPEAKRKARVRDLLEAMKLSGKEQQRPSQLSGGEQQRVAIARALASEPQYVLADEPTANLDSHTGATIIHLMRKMQRELHVSFIISSHDPQMLLEADDAVKIRDGRLVSFEPCGESQKLTQ